MDFATKPSPLVQTAALIDEALRDDDLGALKAFQTMLSARVRRLDKRVELLELTVSAQTAFGDDDTSDAFKQFVATLAAIKWDDVSVDWQRFVDVEFSAQQADGSLVRIDIIYAGSTRGSEPVDVYINEDMVIDGEAMDCIAGVSPEELRLLCSRLKTCVDLWGDD